MNRLDREIMITLLTEPQSLYALEQERRKTTEKRQETEKQRPNYASVYRHVKKMQKEGLLTTVQVLRKNGSPDMRGTEKPQLTPKGLVTLIIEGDLKKEELRIAGAKLLEKSYSSLPTALFSTAQTDIDDIVSNTLLSLKPKLNLKFFDEQYFHKILSISMLDSIIEQFKKKGVPRDEKSVQKAKEYAKKHIPQKTIDSVQELYELVVAERDKYDKYAKFFKETLKALRELKVQ